MRVVRLFIGGLLLFLVASILLLQPDAGASKAQALGRSPAGAQPAGDAAVGQVIASEPVVPVLVGPARNYPPGEPEARLDREINPRIDPYGRTDPGYRIEGGLDPLLAVQANAPAPSDRSFDTPIFNFEGQGYTFLNPPDTVGDVGADHYVQMINATEVSIWDKVTGDFIEAFNLGSLGGCTTTSGDPIVLYDHLADRWLLSEFGPGSSLCVLISTSPDPGGTYYSYQFSTPGFPDYPKYGVWPDAYYVTTNESSPASYALERADMLVGAAATSQRFTAPDLPGFGFQAMTPADLDGPTPPAGAPNYIMRHRDTESHGPGGFPTEDFLEVWAFDVDWTTPANSTFTQVANVSVTEFDSDLCGLFSFYAVAMPGVPKCSTSALDPLREVIMFRLQYRNFGDHEALVGNLTTDVTGNDDAGVRWFELRKSGAGAWDLHQEGTYAPDGDSRWMGAVAMDGAGNIALGYNVSSSTTYPSLRYAGRLSSDPLGTLPQGEYNIVSGTASNGSNRYGDYAAMSVDPVDDCTFWFTGQYNPASQWSTRVAAFRFDECGEPGFSMSTTPATQDICVPEDALYTVETAAISGFTGDIDLSAIGNPGTATFVPNPVPAGDPSQLTISGAAAGAYTFDVYGESGAINRTNTVSLNVFDGAPTAPALSSPPDGATNVSLAPTYTWDAAANATSYFIEVATDAAFTNVVDSATVSGTSYNGAGLTPSTTYYWRVTANNVCGGNTSEVWSFTTSDGSLTCNSTVGFETGAFPPDWYIETNALPGGEWVVSMDNSSAFWDPGPAPEGVYYASANDDLPGSGSNGANDYLYTGIIDLSGYTSASLNFWYHFNGDYGHEAGGVELSGDGGATWDGETIVPMGDDWQQYSLNMDAYAGNSTVRIRFHSDDGGAWASGYAIDAVNVECAGGAPDITVDPASMSSTQETNTIVVQSLDVGNVGTGNLDWAIDEVNGALAGNGCDTPVDIPWLSLNPDAGSTPPSGTSSVDVTYDSTGYAAGTYTGDLCVVSNDPDEPLVVVPVEMIVEQPTDVGLTSFSHNTPAGILPVAAIAILLVIAGLAVIKLRRPEAGN